MSEVKEVDAPSMLFAFFGVFMEIRVLFRVYEGQDVLDSETSESDCFVCLLKHANQSYLPECAPPPSFYEIPSTWEDLIDSRRSYRRSHATTTK